MSLKRRIKILEPYSNVRFFLRKIINMDYKIKTIESYDKNAAEFAERFKKEMDFKKRYEFNKFIELLTGDNILDLWCWSWDHSLFFKQKWFNTTSIDLSKEMINLCKEKWLAAIIMDIENLKFKDKLFDWVWAATSLLHIPKSRLIKVINRLYEIIKDGWILYVSMKYGEGEKLIKYKDGKTARFFSFWKIKELRKIFNDYFDLIETKKTQANGNIYLKAFFIKK